MKGTSEKELFAIFCVLFIICNPISYIYNE